MEPRYAPTYRSDVLRLICNNALDGAAMGLVGVAGTGKSNITNLLNQDPYDYKPGYLGAHTTRVHFPLVDATTLDGTPLNLWHQMLKALNEVTPHLPTPAEGGKVVALNEEERALDRLRHRLAWICQEQEHRVFFLLDDFDRMISQGPLHMLEQLYNLRSRGNKGRLGYLVFTKRLPGVLGRPYGFDTRSKFYDLFCTRVYALEPYDRRDTRQMLDHLNDLRGHPLASTTLESMADLSGGHAGLTRILFELCTARPVHLENVRTLYEETGDIERECRRIFASLHPDEQEAAVRAAHGRATAQDDPALEILERRGLAKRAGGITWFSPLFGHMLETEEGV